jgi:hypothetical protein
VAPTLTVVGTQTIAEGSLLNLVDIGSFTDPGFNNKLNAGNPSNGGEFEETFTFIIDWGDGKPDSAGVATVDAFGSVGVNTAGSFGGSHTYADNGTYVVTVMVFDDDGGQHQRTFAVNVLNVAPALDAIADRTLSEGSLLSITNLGLLSDPGFDNPDNPVVGGELAETFTYTINWGDGTTTEAGGATVDLVGSPGVRTAASFDGAHTYADDGVYTVTVTVFDDDDGQAVRTFLVTVNNVAPTLTLTLNPSLIAPIDEGGTTVVNFSAIFSDPGFDNALNTAPGLSEGPPETFESFTYTVDWGDGKGDNFPYAPGNVPDYDPTYVAGMPGTPTTGSIAETFQHRYTDNDLDGTKDARYTVTVTLNDDDGGVSVRTFEVIVYNVDPHLEPPPTLQATTVNREGQSTLLLIFNDPRITDPADPNEESFEILIDWENDGTFVVEQFVPLTDPQVGNAPRFYAFTHTYLAPPDTDNPAADITITVKIRDDDFGTATSRPENRDLAANPLGTLDGQSNIESVEITNTGLGGEAFRIDTTPQVELLTFPERPVVQADLATDEIGAAIAVVADEGGSAGDSRAAGERFLALQVIYPDGTRSELYRLPSQVLNNLQALFRNLPDNRYAIYLVQSETNARRLVIDVFVRNGKVIDPGDDSEGARDRPPTDEAATAPATPGDEDIKPLPAVDGTVDGAEPIDASSAVEPKADLPNRFPSSTAVYHRTALAGVALALSGAARNWQEQLQQTVAGAKPNQWKRLRTAGHRRRRKPR